MPAWAAHRRRTLDCATRASHEPEVHAERPSPNSTSSAKHQVMTVTPVRGRGATTADLAA